MSFIDTFLARNRKTSYSQCGEDLVSDFFFSFRQPRNKFFVDIGAHHPTYFNNTYFFYKKGWRGVNVDPLINGIALFNRRRAGDVNVHAGIGEKTKDVKFYVMDPETLSTFDKTVADDYIAQGHRLQRQEEVRFLSVDDLIKTYKIPADVGLMSIDIEGGEYQVIRDFLSAGIRPDVLICETAHYAPHLPLASIKNHEVISEIVGLEYFVYADTFINTIFVRRELWQE